MDHMSTVSYQAVFQQTIPKVSSMKEHDPVQDLEDDRYYKEKLKEEAKHFPFVFTIISQDKHLVLLIYSFNKYLLSINSMSVYNLGTARDLGTLF